MTNLIMSLVKKFLEEGAEGIISFSNLPDEAEVTIKAKKAGPQSEVEVSTPNSNFSKKAPESVLAYLAAVDNSNSDLQAVSRVGAAMKVASRDL